MGFHVKGDQLVSAVPAEGSHELTIPKGICTIRPGAFDECPDLEVLHLPITMSISARPVLAACRRLRWVDIPPGHLYYLTARGCLYFKQNHQLVFVPPGMESLEILPGTSLILDRAAATCSLLRSLTLPEGCLSVGLYAFSACTGLTELHLPDTLRNINNGAFSGCTSLRTIRLPSHIQTIGADAFAECGALDVSVPMSCVSIGRNAFDAGTTLHFACPEGCFTCTITGSWDLDGEGRPLLSFLHASDLAERMQYFDGFYRDPIAQKLGFFLGRHGDSGWYDALLQEKADELARIAAGAGDPGFFCDVIAHGGISADVTEQLLNDTLNRPEFYMPLLRYKQEQGQYHAEDSLRL